MKKSRKISNIVLLVAIALVCLSTFANAQLKKKKPVPPTRSQVIKLTPTPTPTPAAVAKVTYKCTETNGLTTAEMDTILAEHNKIRAEFALDPLAWDCKLADFAQEWATRGEAAHRDDTDYGESIFVSGLGSEPVITALDRWRNERASWDNTAGICTTGKVCTHYTQIVWKKTKTVGCGINRNATGKWKTLMVCNYDPAGNRPGPAY